MICTFRNCIKYATGHLDDTVFCSYKKRGYCVARKRVFPKPTDQTVLVGLSMKSISLIWRDVNHEFKADLKTYSIRYSLIHPRSGEMVRNAINSYVVFVMMIWNLKDSLNGSLDIPSLTLDSLRSNYRQISSVYAAVGNGLLPSVEGSEELRQKF